MFGRLGLPPHEVPDNRVHIVTEKEVRDFGGWDQGTALTKHGHVFIQRRADPVQFYQELTHELVHAASFYVLQVHKEGDERVGLGDRRLGLSFTTNNGQSTQTYFNGLSEGVTELMAHHLRRLVSTGATGMTAAQTNQMTRTLFYRPWVEIASAIPDIVANAEGVPVDDVEADLYRDSVTGSYRILKRLEKARPGVVKALRPLVQTSADALRAAEALDLRELAKKLREEAA